jgi:DNA integrity scanning protein DisA with diadenylate cyclase activity
MAAAIGVICLCSTGLPSGKTSPPSHLSCAARSSISGVAIIVLFQSEIRQALISFGNRFRMPLAAAHLGQFGEGAYDEVILAATSLASTKTGALIVIERNVGLKNIIDGGVKLDAELSYDLLVSIFNPESPLHDGAVVVRRTSCRCSVLFLTVDSESAFISRPRNETSRGAGSYRRLLIR